MSTYSYFIFFTFRLAATKRARGKHIKKIFRVIIHWMNLDALLSQYLFPEIHPSPTIKMIQQEGSWVTDWLSKLWYPSWTIPRNNWPDALFIINPSSFWQSIIQIIMEWVGLEGTLMIMQFETPWHRQECHPPNQGCSRIYWTWQ